MFVWYRSNDPIILILKYFKCLLLCLMYGFISGFLSLGTVDILERLVLCECCCVLGSAI